MAILQKRPRVRDEAGVADPQYGAAEIDLDEFEKARRDPTWTSFVKEAKDYREQLRRNGRSS